MEVGIEINKEKSQVKKMISTCQPKTVQIYNRPIIPFKTSGKPNIFNES
jgi:hypothetical protein